MNRLAWIASLACLLVASTGCRMCGGGGGACPPGAYGQPYSDCGDCGHRGDGNGAPVGVIGKLKAYGGGGGSSRCGQGVLGRMCGMCGLGKCLGGSCGRGTGETGTCGPGGCTAGLHGGQQGGHDYSAHLRAGPLGHNAPAALNNRPFTPGPPSAQVGYPYYTHHGPRDFLLDDPPTLGR